MKDQMEQEPGYIKHVDMITKAEFIRLFSETELLGDWFTENELKAFSYPRNSGSLAARYLIKKRICDLLEEDEYKREIEILNDSLGKPQLSFLKNINNAIERAGISKILCSISHSRNYIAGMTIFCF